MSIHEADRQAISAVPEGQPLSEADAEGWLPHTCFKNGPPGRVGVELEFVVHSAGGLPRHLSPDRLREAHADIRKRQLASRFTSEPGGQVELSSLPADSLREALHLMEQDLHTLRSVLCRHGARLVGRGVDPLPEPPRILDEPRYAAMERYFDGDGPAGRTMMRRTASVQVNVEAGSSPGDFRERWDLLHAAGPVLAAAFDTSGGRRQRVWRALDPLRCRAPEIRAGESLPEAWTRWVLDAPLMLVRRESGDWTPPAGSTFRDWIRGATRLPPPTLDDLRYHLTTLFPPVRARGHLEVRYLDAQPGPFWRVAAAVVPALLDDGRARDAAQAAVGPTAGLWDVAAATGLEDPRFAAAARALLGAAAESLDRSGARDLAQLTYEYLDRKNQAREDEPC